MSTQRAIQEMNTRKKYEQYEKVVSSLKSIKYLIIYVSNIRTICTENLEILRLLQEIVFKSFQHMKECQIMKYSQKTHYGSDERENTALKSRKYILE